MTASSSEPDRRFGPLPFALLLHATATLVGGGATTLTAQAPRLEVDLTASRIEYDSLSSLNAPSLASLLEWRTPAVLGRLYGSVTGFEGGTWSVRGGGDVSGWMAPLHGLPALRLELAGGAAASHHSSGFESHAIRGDARLHLARSRAGLWAGAGVTVAKSSFDSASVTGLVPTVGAWAQRGPVRGTLHYAHPRVAGVRYPEISAVVTLSDGPFDITLYGGVRRSSLATTAFDDEWLGASATVWASPHAAVTLAGGRSASDIYEGLPGGSFLSLGIRLTPRRSRPIPRMVASPIVYTTDQVRSGGITLTVPGADRVEIAGDWNGWQLEPLERVGDDQWRVPDSVGPGVHRFNLRVDGERWIVPDGVPEVEGNYGDRVGLLIISGG